MLFLDQQTQLQLFKSDPKCPYNTVTCYSVVTQIITVPDAKLT